MDGFKNKELFLKNVLDIILHAGCKTRVLTLNARSDLQIESHVMNIYKVHSHTFPINNSVIDERILELNVFDII
jgi:hypothetical protein